MSGKEILPVLALVSGIWMSCAGSAVVANETAATLELDARQKINLSGRQRMLTQRMTAATCLVMAGASPQDRATIANNAHEGFAQTLKGLQAGDADLNLLAEENPEILAALATVESNWAIMGPAIQQILHHDLHTVPVEQILRLNVTLLKQSDAAVTQIVKTHGASSGDPRLAKTMNMAGRQRMLSQKMMKEVCFVWLDLNTETQRANLEQSVAEFETALEQLAGGDEANGIVEPVSLQQKLLFRNLKNQWPFFRDAMLAIQPNDEESFNQLERLAKQADALLKESNRAVQLYVEN